MEKIIKCLICLFISLFFVLNSDFIKANEEQETIYVSLMEMNFVENLLREKAELYQAKDKDIFAIYEIEQTLKEYGVEIIDFEANKNIKISTYADVWIPSSENVEYSSYHVKTNHQGTVYDCQVITGLDLGQKTGFLRTSVDIDDRTLSGYPTRSILEKVTLALIDQVPYIGTTVSTYTTFKDLFDTVNAAYSNTITYNVLSSYTISIVSTSKHVAIKPDGSSDSNIMIGYFGESYKLTSIESHIIPQVGGDDTAIANIQKINFESEHVSSEALTEACKGYVDGITRNEKITSVDIYVGTTKLKTVSLGNHNHITDPIIDTQ